MFWFNSDKLNKDLLRWIDKIEALRQDTPRIITKNDEAKYEILQGDIYQYVSSRNKKKIHEHILLIDNEIALSRKRRKEVYCIDCNNAEGRSCRHGGNTEASSYTGEPQSKNSMEYYRENFCRGFHYSRESNIVDTAKHKFPFTIVDQYNTVFVEFPNLAEAMAALDKEYTDNYTVVETHTLERL
jgi:hypothetical protein